VGGDGKHHGPGRVLTTPQFSTLGLLDRLVYDHPEPLHCHGRDPEQVTRLADLVG
jgi:hypothetical protein